MLILVEYRGSLAEKATRYPQDRVYWWVNIWLVASTKRQGPRKVSYPAEG
jgi:hypothetical protein